MQRLVTLDSNGNYQLQMRMRLKTMFFSVTGSNTVNVYLSTSIGQKNGIPVLTGQALSIERWDTESEDFNVVLFNGTAGDTFVVFWTEYNTQACYPTDGTQPAQNIEKPNSSQAYRRYPISE